LPGTALAGNSAIAALTRTLFEDATLLAGAPFQSVLGAPPRPIFVDPATRELLGFEALVFAYQYLSLSIVSVVRAAICPILPTGLRRRTSVCTTQELAELQRLGASRSRPS
jgi:hypothetical protein